jgi:hypothetical protein
MKLDGITDRLAVSAACSRTGQDPRRHDRMSEHVPYMPGQAKTGYRRCRMKAIVVTGQYVDGSAFISVDRMRLGEYDDRSDPRPI